MDASNASLEMRSHGVRRIEVSSADKQMQVICESTAQQFAGGGYIHNYEFCILAYLHVHKNATKKK